jgi:hypothetical protein
VIEAFTGASASGAGPDEILIETPRGEIEIMAPTVFQDRFEEPAPEVSQGARLVALRLADRRGGARTLVEADRLFGATLVFEPEE